MAVILKILGIIKYLEEYFESLQKLKRGYLDVNRMEKSGEGEKQQDESNLGKGPELLSGFKFVFCLVRIFTVNRRTDD